jgi:hypothetical protein
MPGDAHKALRVSRYFGTDDAPRQFRFSIWSGDRADAAVSLSDDEAWRLAQLLSPPPQRRPLLQELKESLRL